MRSDVSAVWFRKRVFLPKGIGAVVVVVISAAVFCPPQLNEARAGRFALVVRLAICRLFFETVQVRQKGLQPASASPLMI